jgi:N-acetylglutamate synthase
MDMGLAHIETVRMAEERLVNVWPAPSTLLMDGWVVRFGHGYSGRANSASAVIPGARLSDDLIAIIEKLYEDAGLVPSVRVTPLADVSVEPILLRRGYSLKDQCRTMLAALPLQETTAADNRIRLEGAASRRWLAGVSARQKPSKRSADHLFAIVGALRVPAAFATLEIGGEAVGFGMAAIDRGWAEISSVMLDTAHRGKGLGRATVNALLAWAAQEGASRAFLQVEASNTVAISLYRNLGFSDLCGYKTLIKL